VLLAAAAEGCCCPFFRHSTNDCSIYDRRPLDCRLYPLLLMYDRMGQNVCLAADAVCPFVQAKMGKPEWEEAVGEIAGLLEGPLSDAIVKAPLIVSSYQEQARAIRPMPELTRRVCRADLGLARLVSTCQAELGDFFRARPSHLTGHTFPAIYLCRDAFNLYWAVEADRLLLFAESDGVSFLIAPPLGNGDMGQALKRARQVMEVLNGPHPGARVQEVDEESLPLFTAAGWRVAYKAVEYLYRTDDLAELRGRRYSAKRHDCRRFERSHRAIWRAYEPGDFHAAVALLRKWQAERHAHNADAFYRAQLADTGFLHVRTLREALMLGMAGHVVLIGDQLAAYTFGFPLNDGQTFADFIEVADLTYPGLPAFVYREFCREHRAHQFINAGTDSGLPNLARAKRSYHPCSVIPSYTVVPPENTHAPPA